MQVTAVRPASSRASEHLPGRPARYQQVGRQLRVEPGQPCGVGVCQRRRDLVVIRLRAGIKESWSPF